MFAVFRRPLMQVGLGVVVGGWLVAQLARSFMNGLSAREIGLLIAYASLMLAVCLFACINPTCRALAIEPTEVALREDGWSRLYERAQLDGPPATQDSGAMSTDSHAMVRDRVLLRVLAH